MAITVSPAPETSNTSRASAATLRMAALGPHQRHAALGAGAEQAPAARPRASRPGGGHHLGFGAGRQPRRARELAGVGGEAVGAAVEAEIVALRVGEDRHARLRAPRRSARRDHRRRQHALGVVRQDQRLAAGQRGSRTAATSAAASAASAGRASSSSSARTCWLPAMTRILRVLRRSALPTVASSIARVAGERAPRSSAAASSSPEQPDEHRLAAQRRDVARHVAGAARHGVARGGAAPPAPAPPARSGPPRRRGSGRASRRRGRARGRRRNRAWARYAPRPRRMPARPGAPRFGTATACPGLEDLRERDRTAMAKEEDPPRRPTTAPRAGAR